MLPGRWKEWCKSILRLQQPFAATRLKTHAPHVANVCVVGSNPVACLPRPEKAADDLLEPNQESLAADRSAGRLVPP